MKLVIGSDHAGYVYKARLVEYLTAAGHTVSDVGPSSEASVDYPDYAHPVALAVEQGQAEAGILICGSANGVAMTANKHQGIRAAICWTPEIAALARRHNDANVICLPARFVSWEMACEMTEVFLKTAFEGGRHAGRTAKIACM
jgi:ribose 5-phosphate isomerase B